jgi:hypothetical protein
MRKAANAAFNTVKLLTTPSPKLYNKSAPHRTYNKLNNELDKCKRCDSSISPDLNCRGGEGPASQFTSGAREAAKNNTRLYTFSYCGHRRCGVLHFSGSRDRMRGNGGRSEPRRNAKQQPGGFTSRTEADQKRLGTYKTASRTNRYRRVRNVTRDELMEQK